MKNTHEHTAVTGHANLLRLLILTNILLLLLVGFLTYRTLSASANLAAPSLAEISARVDASASQSAETKRSLDLLVAAVEAKGLVPDVTAVNLVPEPLSSFLTEAQKPGSNFTADQLEAKRKELISVVNSLPALRRDQLAAETTEANWLLEAHYVRAAGMPQEISDRAAQSVVIKGLLEGAAAENNPDLSEFLTDRRNEITKSLQKEMEGLRDSFAGDSKAQPSDESLGALRVAASVLSDNVEGDAQDFPGLLWDLRQWNKNADKLLDEKSATAAPVQLTRLGIAQDEGLQLQRQLVALDLPLPPNIDLPKKITALQEKAASVQRQALGNYQKWALEQIAIVHDLGGEKAAAAVDEALDLASEDANKAVQTNSFIDVMSGPVVREKLRTLTKMDLPSDAPLTAAQASAVCKALGGMTSGNLGWTGNKELAQCLNRDLLEQRLLKIDESLLSTPVGKLYAEVFEKCWAALEDYPQRVEVAKSAAVAEKRRPDQLQESPTDRPVPVDKQPAQNTSEGFAQFKAAMADVAGNLPQQRRKEIADAIAAGNATAGIYVVSAAIDFRDGKPDSARKKLEEANKRATAQEMRTMLGEEFFHDHIQFNQTGVQTP